MNSARCPLCNDDAHTVKASGIVASQTSSMRWRGGSATSGTIYNDRGNRVGATSAAGPTWGSGEVSTPLADRIRRVQGSRRFPPWRPFGMPEWLAKILAISLIVWEVYGRRLLGFSGFIGVMVAYRISVSVEGFVWRVGTVFAISMPVLFLVALTANYRWVMRSSGMHQRIQGTFTRLVRASHARRRRWEADMDQWRREQAQLHDLWYCSKHDVLLWPNLQSGGWVVFPE